MASPPTRGKVPSLDGRHGDGWWPKFDMPGEKWGAASQGHSYACGLTRRRVNAHGDAFQNVLHGVCELREFGALKNFWHEASRRRSRMFEFGTVTFLGVLGAFFLTSTVSDLLARPLAAIGLALKANG